MWAVFGINNQSKTLVWLRQMEKGCLLGIGFIKMSRIALCLDQKNRMHIAIFKYVCRFAKLSLNREYESPFYGKN